MNLPGWVVTPYMKSEFGMACILFLSPCRTFFSLADSKFLMGSFKKSHNTPSTDPMVFNFGTIPTFFADSIDAQGNARALKRIDHTHFGPRFMFVTLAQRRILLQAHSGLLNANGKLGVGARNIPAYRIDTQADLIGLLTRIIGNDPNVNHRHPVVRLGAFGQRLINGVGHQIEGNLGTFINNFQGTRIADLARVHQTLQNVGANIEIETASQLGLVPDEVIELIADHGINLAPGQHLTLRILLDTLADYGSPFRLQCRLRLHQEGFQQGIRIRGCFAKAWHRWMVNALAQKHQDCTACALQHSPSHLPPHPQDPDYLPTLGLLQANAIRPRTMETLVHFPPNGLRTVGKRYGEGKNNCTQCRYVVDTSDCTKGS